MQTPAEITATTPAARAGRPLASSAWAALRALRPHHWSKNALVFAPILGAHQLADRRAVAATALAFVAFSLAASTAYVVNDVIDLEADRRHPEKRGRPFAAGDLPLWTAWVIALGAAGGAAAVAALLPGRFAALIGAYAVASLAYSLWIKKKLIADVLCLAGLYTARIYAGSLATAIPVSEWLATFSMFFFVSLAFLKRASELHDSREALPRRGYGPDDRETVLAMGTSAGYLATLVLALYVSSHEVRRLYSSPQWLWALCPLVLYWLSRMWIQARRGLVREDPLMYAVRFRATWAVAAAAVVFVLLGSL